MVAARRLFVYLISAAGLWLVTAGAIGLLRVVADAFGLLPAWESGAGSLREELSRSLALTVVGLPLWAAPTWYAERLAGRDDPSGADERRSALRALYLAAAGTIVFWIGAVNVQGVIRDTILAVTPAPVGEYSGGGPDIASGAATALVLLVAYATLGRFRLRDLDRGPIAGRAATFGRLGLYGTAVAGLVIAISGLLQLLQLAIDLVIGPAAVGDASWWRYPLANGVAGLVVGLGAWGLHERIAGRLAARDDAVGASERSSWVRPAAAAAFLAICTLSALFGLSASLGTLLSWPVATDSRTARDVLEPLLGAIVYLAALVWRRGDARAEALDFGGAARLGGVVRLTDLAVAAVGLAFVGVGTARALAILVDQVGGAHVVATSGSWVETVIQQAAFALAGLPAWIWGWSPELRRSSGDPAGAAASPIRRAFLFLAAGVALVAAAGGIAFTLYQVLRTVMGLEAGALLSRCADALGAAISGAIVLAYHAVLLRRDSAIRAELPAAEAAGAAVPASGVAAGAAGALLVPRFVVRGPAGAPTDGLAARLAQDLPEGWSVEEAGESREVRTGG